VVIFGMSVKQGKVVARLVHLMLEQRSFFRLNLNVNIIVVAVAASILVVSSGAGLGLRRRKKIRIAAVRSAHSGTYSSMT
jgi:hypothetical protein